MNTESEATMIANNMARMPGYEGTTTAEVVDNILSRFSTLIFCNGYGRRMIFTKITDKFFSFKTVDSL